MVRCQVVRILVPFKVATMIAESDGCNHGDVLKILGQTLEHVSSLKDAVVREHMTASIEVCLHCDRHLDCTYLASSQLYSILTNP